MYQILDERDKILSKARVRSGTCMDMCPEKERYLRVVQKRINPYECNAEGKMMAEITVKDYSRSAADQEEPLPHELRPAEVLSRTMNYLIANEVPSKDEELCVWYDFLWNRTRAIRKDITQQMMVNETAVMLNEQCARFHIFAAHRLCKLDNNEFDQKMNTENLSKCLQSLRHLYEDLGKKGVYCKSEAEFRAYDIMYIYIYIYNFLRGFCFCFLLIFNFFSADVQVLSYRPEIRTSSVVKFALQLFSSYQSGNYRRFFKLLLEKADYLQVYFSISCFIYFFNFPLHKLTGLLGFDDDDQSREMARFYGFDEFVQPKERPVLMHSWIEKKKDFTSLSKVALLLIFIILFLMEI
uniref:SAC3_GANP domain-containing protein n=1 Tax=Syphacia muris TaxID=451379 RepID=A0A0N5AQS0_9BILA